MVISMAEAGTLEDQALKRKERLKLLKRKKEGDHEDISTQEDLQKLPKPKFRSYKPESNELQEKALPVAEPANIEEVVKDQLESAKTKVVIDELDIVSLAPRKPDWDLKRDLSKKLEKLERRTQKSIGELIRERLKQSEDLAEVVESGTYHNN